MRISSTKVDRFTSSQNDKVINGPFYTYRRIHSTSGNASFVVMSVIIWAGHVSQRPPGRVPICLLPYGMWLHMSWWSCGRLAVTIQVPTHIHQVSPRGKISYCCIFLSFVKFRGYQRSLNSMKTEVDSVAASTIRHCIVCKHDGQAKVTEKWGALA